MTKTKSRRLKLKDVKYISNFNLILT